MKAGFPNVSMDETDSLGDCILPVVRDKVQSKLNNFREYTILDALSLAEYVGFTADEVKSLCEEYKMDYDECRQWYVGYYQHGYEIYNPESVVMSMTAKRYGNYWNRTSTYMAIAERILPFIWRTYMRSMITPV